MNSTAFFEHGQLFLNLSIPLKLDFQNPVKALHTLLWSLDYSCFSKQKKVSGRPNALSPRKLMFILVYARLNNCFSSREVEALCKRDLVCIHVLEGGRAPDHSTIDRFVRSNAEPIRDIFAQSIRKLDELGELGRKIAFIDGTKIESKAGKYTFVWLSGIEKNLPKLVRNIAKLYEQYLEHYRLDSPPVVETESQAKVALDEMIEAIDPYEVLSRPCKQGRGHRKGFERMLSERVVEYSKKLAFYQRARDRMKAEGRRSMSKTDEDATFMRMKEDHMLNGQLKPGYNIQNIVDSGYIVGTYCSRDRADMHTFVPALEQLRKRLGFEYEGICADSGYDCVENYRYLENRGIETYIKTQTYEQNKKRKMVKDPGNKLNMTYDGAKDRLRCINNAILHNTGKKKSDGTSLYEAKKGCVGCAYRKACMKGQATQKKFKRMQYNPVAEGFRSKSLSNIISEKGIEARLNRSIQVEGSFALIKDALGIRRFLNKGMVNVETEWIILCMAANALKLQAKINRGRLGFPTWYHIVDNADSLDEAG